MTNHYFTTDTKKVSQQNRTDVAARTPTIFTYLDLDTELTFTTASNVFAREYVDFGTRRLFKYMQIDSALLQSQTESAQSQSCGVLDLGCGYGVVGIVVLARHPKLPVWFSDVTEQAILTTKRNLTQNKSLFLNSTYKVVRSDGFAHPNLASANFGLILLNPPFSAGKQVCMRLIRESYEHLVTGGSLQFVAPRKKGGESLAKYAAELFTSCEVLGKSGGFWVYKCTK